MFIQAIYQKLKKISTKVLGNKDHLKILFNTGWLLLDRIVRMLVGLVVGVWAARYLGPEQFGQLNYAIAWVSIFSAVSSLGLESIVVRELVLNPQSKDSILGTTFWLRIVSGVSIWVLILFLSQLFSLSISKAFSLIFILSTGIIFQSFETIELWFQSQVQSNFIVKGKIIPFLIINIIKIILIKSQASLYAFAWIGFGEICLGAISLLTIYRLQGNNIFKWRFYLSKAKDLLNDSYPLILSSLLIMIYMRVDQIMISILSGERELGLYSVAVRLSEIWYFLPIAIASSTFPNIVETKKVDEALFYRKLQKLYVLMVALGYAIAIPITFTSNYLISILYGSTYNGSGTMLAILTWAGIFVNLGVARSSFLMSMNWTKLHSFTVFLGAIINVILNLLLIPLLGGVGASISTVFSYWVATHLSCFTQERLFISGKMITKSLLLRTS